MYTQYNKYTVYFYSKHCLEGAEINPMWSPISDQCYYYAKYNTNTPKSINYYSMYFFNFIMFFIK